MSDDDIFDRRETEYLEEMVRCAFDEDTMRDPLGYVLWWLQLAAQMFLQPKWRRGRRLPDVTEGDAALVSKLHARLIEIGAAIRAQGNATPEQCARLAAVAAALGALQVRYQSVSREIEGAPRRRGSDKLAKYSAAKDKVYRDVAKKHFIDLEARGAAAKLAQHGIKDDERTIRRRLKAMLKQK